MSIFQETFSHRPKRSLSKFFTKKSSLENLCSFLTPKETFRLLCNSKELAKEFDSKIDDVFMPREYQDKIKTYENYYNDLFYQILMEMKRKADNKGEKIKLYEIENDMVKYLKYLNKKFDKKIKLSLNQIVHMEPWKLDFISKLILSLEKNVHLVINMNLTHFKTNDYYVYFFQPSKAINTVEILDIAYNPRDRIINDYLKTAFDWSHIKKLIINSNEIDFMDTLVVQKKNYGYKFLNNANISNLEELDFKCKDTNYLMLEHFFYKCSKVKKLSMKYLKFKNFSDIGDNSILKSFDNITDLKLTSNLDNLDYVLYYFYPIFPRIKNFHLEISTEEDEEYVNNTPNFIKARNISQKKTYGNEYEQFANEYLKDDFIGDSKDISTNKISFSTNNNESINKLNKKAIVNFSYDAEKQGNEPGKDNLNEMKILSTLLNLTQCESLTYEIKEQKALFNNKNNKLNDLIDILEINKMHLKYLDINIYNDDDISINIHLFTHLIQKISECKQLCTFILRLDLMDDYAKIFNKFFNVGDNLTKIYLIHSTDLDIMSIIKEHKNLNSINLELIMNEPDYSKENYEKYSFDLVDTKHQWKEIELTNYPINRRNLDYLINNKDAKICLNVCVNLTEMDDLSFGENIKNFIN